MAGPHKNGYSDEKGRQQRKHERQAIRTEKKKSAVLDAMAAAQEARAAKRIAKENKRLADESSGKKPKKYIQQHIWHTHSSAQLSLKLQVLPPT